MPITVFGAINSQNAEPIHLYKRDTGRYEDGLWIDGKVKIVRAMASVQQPKPEELKLLTGLERVAGAKVFYINRRVDSSDFFKEGDSTHFAYRGEEYKAMSNAEWTAFGYSKVIAKVSG